MVELALHVGVEQGLVALAAAPEDVARAAEFLGDFHGLLDLGGGVGEDVGVGVGGGAVPCSADCENRLAVPQSSLTPVSLLQLLGQRRRPRRGCLLVSASVSPSGAMSRSWKHQNVDAELGEELEGRLAASSSATSIGSPAVVPGADHRAGAERVGAQCP